MSKLTRPPTPEPTNEANRPSEVTPAALSVVLEHREVPWSVEAQHAFDRAVARLQDRLARYGLHADRLVAEFTPQGQAIRARLELALDPDAQTATVAERDVSTALRTAFDALFRRFDAYTWARDHGRWRPLAGRARDPGDVLHQYHEALLRFALPALHRVAAHDIARLRESELMPGDWLDPAEIVDAAVADALPRLDGHLEIPKATLELVRAVREELMARVTEVHEHEVDVSLEEPMQESLQLDEGDDNDWPLDVMSLNLGDVLGDPSLPDAERFVAERERREQLVEALFRVRDPDRAMFTQIVLDAWTDDVVSAAWNVSVDVVRRAVGRVAAQLSGVLGDVEPEEVVDLYRQLGERLHEERKALERRMAER